MSDTNYKIGVVVDASSAPRAAAHLAVFDNALARTGRAAQTFSSGVTSIGSSYGNLVGAVASGNPAILVATAGISGLAVATNQFGESLQRASSYDSARRGLTAVSVSAEAAGAKIKELDKVAKDTQGLKFRQAIEGQRNLEAAKIESSEATRELKAFANAMAIVGGTEADFDGVLRALTQIASKSQISAEEINQLTERVPQIRAVMQAVYGTSDTEVLQKRGIDPKDFLRNITTELEKLPRATGSAAGGWENLTDAIDKAYVKVGEPALPTATRLLDKMTALVEENGATWEAWGKKLERAIKIAEDVTSVIAFLNTTQLPKFIDYLDKIVTYTNGANIQSAISEAIGGVPDVSGDIDKFTASQKAATDQTGKLAAAQKANSQATVKSIADLRRLEDTNGQVGKTSKEEFDERLVQLDAFYRTSKNKISAGVRDNKTEELSYQRSLLGLEQESFNRRIASINEYWKARIAAAKNGREKEQLAEQGQQAVSAATLDFADTRAGISNTIAQLSEGVKQQLRSDLSDALKINLDGFTAGLATTLDDLSEKFDEGKIHATDYWLSAQKALIEYGTNLRSISQDQLTIKFQDPSLTPEQKSNEAERAKQTFLEAERQINEKGKAIKKLIIDFQATSDRGALDHFIEIESNINEATVSLLEFYRTLKENPGLAPDPINSDDEVFADFAKQLKKNYAEFINSAAFNETELLELRQKAAEQAYLTKIDYLQKESAYFEKVNNPKKQKEVEKAIEQAESQLISVRAKNAEELAKFKIAKEEEYKQKAIEVSNAVRDASQSEYESRINLQRAVIENRKIQPGTNLDTLNQLTKLEREKLLKTIELDRKRLEAEQKAAKKSVETVKNKNELITQIEAEFRLKDLALTNAYLEKLAKLEKDAADKRVEAKRKDAADRDPFGSAVVGGIRDTTGLGSLDEAIGNATTQAESRTAAIKSVYQDLGATVVDVFGQMASAAQSTLESYILTGEGGAAAFAQLTAAVIASIAVQAGVKALFELAEGFAAAARFDPVSAAGHFTAAKIYGVVAVGALATGLAIGAAGGLSGGKGKDNQTNQPDYVTANSNNNNNQNNQSGNSQIRILSGNLTDTEVKRLAERIGTLSDAVGGLNEKVTSFRPGDVLGRGIKEEKGLISQTMTKELSSDSTQVSKLSRVMNLK